jgi:thiosulfate/3-mercaptopyruvate sulfurtransferase
MDKLVSTEWLAGELGAEDLRVVDATAFLPGSDRDPAAEYEAAHIPGAMFLNLDELRDTDDPRPMMLPSPEKFSSRMQSLGLGDGSRIVVYDNSPIRTAARAWWMFNIFGAHNVAILDGGLQKWTAEERDTENGKPSVRHRHFTAWKDDSAVRTKADILANIDSKEAVLVDARSSSRFTGEEPEVREGMVSGHIPGSRNLPYSWLFNEDGTYKQGDDLRAAFDKAGVDFEKPLITTCGGGVTAACIFFAASLLGKSDIGLYDGSWSEWGVDPETPKATGAA